MGKKYDEVTLTYLPLLALMTMALLGCLMLVGFAVLIIALE
ncbi:hypothetical protein [Caenibius tardaugens]|nr:hypothetical protein [Caenibius tardaugens]